MLGDQRIVLDREAATGQLQLRTLVEGKTTQVTGEIEARRNRVVTAECDAATLPRHQAALAGFLSAAADIDKTAALQLQAADGQQADTTAIDGERVLYAGLIQGVRGALVDPRACEIEGAAGG